jgi:hypothetical protein
MVHRTARTAGFGFLLTEKSQKMGTQYNRHETWHDQEDDSAGGNRRGERHSILQPSRKQRRQEGLISTTTFRLRTQYTGLGASARAHGWGS